MGVEEGVGKPLALSVEEGEGEGVMGGEGVGVMEVVGEGGGEGVPLVEVLGVGVGETGAAGRVSCRAWSAEEDMTATACSVTVAVPAGAVQDA